MALHVVRLFAYLNQPTNIVLLFSFIKLKVKNPSLQILQELYPDYFTDEVIQAEYFQKLAEFVAEERKKYIIYPEKKNVFNALKVPPSEVKVVILGQDPYHAPGQANGYCFSVPKGIPLPPSLINIFKELKDDLGIDRGNNGDLTGWAQQGVMLLNAVLTVRQGQPGSHANRGWEIFTDHVIKTVQRSTKNVIFVLWGAYAKKKQALIDPSRHFVITGAHPSPLSAYQGFFGGKYFSRINALLIEKGKIPIDWSR
ncbi:uracil-DNA glycosylase [Thermaurantimonas aggregans]|uniref:Uracil-DNA glycosylase n=1 Tax=Thermaurantimonas aggregans TaxID=2173829 RepID=A0A401XKR7_9FLAO|nr:uracil-DNA glycosylase [Thermaurantimonas aggregans]